MRSATWEQPHYVYTVWDAEHRPIYVGMTSDLRKRMSQHKAGSAWMSLANFIETTTYPNRVRATRGETERIRELRPLVNRKHNPRYWPDDYTCDCPTCWNRGDVESLARERIAESA